MMPTLKTFFKLFLQETKQIKPLVFQHRTILHINYLTYKIINDNKKVCIAFTHLNTHFYTLAYNSIYSSFS